MSDRTVYLVSVAGGLVWSVLLIWGAVRFVEIPVFALMPTIMSAFLVPGLVLMAMIASVGLRRLGNESYRDGGPMEGSAQIDQRVLRNTGEQLVLAMCIWPAAAVLLGGAGPGLIAVLGMGFAVSRLAYWVGYHRSTMLRTFGFAAGFYPTVLVALWACYQAAFGFQ